MMMSVFKLFFVTNKIMGLSSLSTINSMQLEDNDQLLKIVFGPTGVGKSSLPSGNQLGVSNRPEVTALVDDYVEG